MWFSKKKQAKQAELLERYRAAQAKQTERDLEAQADAIFKAVAIMVEQVRTTFLNHYRKMLQSAESSPIAQNPEFELLPAMFVVADYAAASSQKNRRMIAKDIMSAIPVAFNQGFDKVMFDKRCNLYGEIIRGKALRAEWYKGDPSDLNDHPIGKCIGLLGDILYNPQCAENYDTAPIVLHDMIESITFAKVMTNHILPEMANFFKEIYTL